MFDGPQERGLDIQAQHTKSGKLKSRVSNALTDRERQAAEQEKYLNSSRA